MAENLNLTGSILEFLNDIGQHWTRKKGLLLAIVFEAVVFAFLWDRCAFKNVYVGLSTVFGVAVIIFAIWLITSKRILFRSGWLVFFWLVFSLGCSFSFYAFFYSKHIKDTSLDVPFIQIWGSLLLFIVTLFLSLLLDCLLFKGNKLMILFAVNNESVAVEKTIRASIEPVVQSILDTDSKIRLVVLPFGVIKSVRQSARFIKFPLTRADAIIFASVVDDSDSSPAGYVFTGFSSRINESRFSKEEQGPMHNRVLDVNLHCRDWNFLNSANDNCSRKIAISKNLEDMLRMYIGCMYLMKHDFDAALPYTNNAICNESKSSPSYVIASSLYSYSILSSALVLENDRRQYDAALNQLNQLIVKMPVTGGDPGYNKAMARVMFYKGDIKASESYTRKFKDLPNHRWGYELNMGFYAINKKKALEFVQHYKNLKKYYPCDKKEVDFAIRFLERQEKETKDNEYRTLLRIAIAYLNMYRNPKVARKLISRIEFSSDNDRVNKAISELKEIVEEPTTRFEIVPRRRK